jgi:hypothetical protein
MSKYEPTPMGNAQAFGVLNHCFPRLCGTRKVLNAIYILSKEEIKRLNENDSHGNPKRNPNF